MNSDFNLQDPIYYKGNPGKIVGLLEGGDKVIVLVDGQNETIPYDHTELLTLKQKKHRDAIKANNAKINENAIAAATQAPKPASRDVAPLGQVDKPAPAAATEAPKAAPAPVEVPKAETPKVEAPKPAAPKSPAKSVPPTAGPKAPEAKIVNTSSLNGADTKPE